MNSIGCYRYIVIARAFIEFHEMIRHW